MGRKDKSPVHRISHDLCRYSALKEGGQNSLLLKCGLYILTSLQKPNMERGKKMTL